MPLSQIDEGTRSSIDRRSVLQALAPTGVAGLTGCLATATEDISSGAESAILDVASDANGRGTLTLGGSMSLSGVYADLGQLYRDAYELTISHINEAGGVKASDGTAYDLEIILRDDGSDASRSEEIYRELIDEAGVDYLLGPYSSTVTLQASAVAARFRKPMVAGGGASPAIFRGDNEWIFSLLPSAVTYPVRGIDMALAQPEPPSSAAILAKDETFSQSSAAGAREKLVSAGVDIVVDQTYPREVTDLTIYLERIEDTTPESLILCGHQRDAVATAEHLAARHIDLDMAFATVGTLTDAFREATGPDGDYWYGPSPWAINADFEDDVFGSTGNFVSAIETEFGYAPNYHSAAGSAVVQTFRQAFTAVDELTPEAVRDTIRHVQFETLYGTIQFTDEGVIERDMVVYQWQPTTGKQLVWPAELRQSDPIYPTPSWDDR